MPETASSNEKEKQKPEDGESSVYLGPVQITDEDNEWNKRALEISAKELRAVPAT